MNIIIFSTNYLPHIGGAELAIKEVTSRIDSADFTLITARLDADRQPHEQIGNVEVFRVGFGARFDVFLLAGFGWIKALWLHWQRDFDLTWSMMASQGGIAAAFFALVSRLPLVLTLQEGEGEAHLKRYVGGSDFLYQLLIQPFHYFVFYMAEHITAISEHLRKRADHVRPQASKSVIPNGVDLEVFTKPYPSEEVAPIRSSYVEADDTLIISTSRLAVKNGLSDLISSLQYLSDSCHVLILGEGNQREALQLQAEEAGVADRVHMPGRVDFDQIPLYLAAADIFARPSLSEGMGNSFIEAMAADVPVVATPVGGITDFLEHEETGLLAEVSQPKSIAQQIKRLQKNQQLRSKIVHAAYELVTTEYSWANIATQYKNVFTQLAK